MNIGSKLKLISVFINQVRIILIKDIAESGYHTQHFSRSSHCLDWKCNIFFFKSKSSRFGVKLRFLFWKETQKTCYVVHNAKCYIATMFHVVLTSPALATGLYFCGAGWVGLFCSACIKSHLCLDLWEQM